METKPILVFSRRVREGAISEDKITQKADKEKILDVAKSLLQLGRSKSLDELELKENCREWVISLLSKFPEIDDQDIRYLINDFTATLQTRMREEDKYAVSVLSDEGLLLCHSIFGEKTITPSWKVIERMLDKDNVIRFVYFKKENELIKVVYYETYPSDSFVNWLGIPEREAFYYFGGKNRIYVEINGLSCALELTDEDIEDNILNGTLKIEENHLFLPNPLQRLQITQIRVGNKRYNEIGDFLQDYLARRYELSYYQNEYHKINDSLTPILNKVIDDRDYLLVIEEGEEKILVRKRNPNFYIVFMNQNIEIRESFLNEIITRFLNKQSMKVFHAGMSLSPNPLKISSMEIFNQLNCSAVTKSIIEHYHKVGLSDISIDRSILCTIFGLLKQENEEKPIEYLLGRMIEKISRDIDTSKKFIEKESNFIEFKSRDFFFGRDEDIIDKFELDIKRKLSISPIKIYIIGADEKTHRLDPIPANRAQSDRLSSLQEKLKEKLDISKIHFMAIPLEDGQNCILMLIASREKTSH
jgi:hypothetical protein